MIHIFRGQASEDLYSTWITLEAQGRARTVLIAASATNQPLGYVSCHLDRRHARRGRSGWWVSARRFAGKGIGKIWFWRRWTGSGHTRREK